MFTSAAGSDSVSSFFSGSVFCSSESLSGVSCFVSVSSASSPFTVFSFSVSALFSVSFVSAFYDVSVAAPGASDTSPSGMRLHDDSDIIMTAIINNAILRFIFFSS